MEITFSTAISDDQFAFVQALPAAITGADAREMSSNPLRIYAFNVDMIMGYIEYKVHGDRVEISWIANWATSCGFDGLDERLLHHACCLWDMSNVPNVHTNVRICKQDPTWLCASQMNLLYRNGFSMAYWTCNEIGEISHRMNRRGRAKSVRM
jgi:hypothetical protein